MLNIESFLGSYCCTECKDEFIKMFGRNMHSIKSRRVQESIWRLHEEIEDRTKLFKSEIEATSHNFSA